MPHRIWRAHIFGVVDHWMELLLTALRATHQGLWLGILDREALHRVAEKHYLSLPMYRSLDFNLSGLFLWEEAVVDRFFTECHSVLLGAAGGGREIIALARRGIQVHAFECLPELVESCRRLMASEGITTKVIVSPPDEVPQEFGIYDGLIMGWAGYMHIAGRETRVRYLQQFRRHVRPGGPILLSFFPRRREAAQFRMTFAMARFIRRLRKSEEPVELGDTLLGVFDHCFTREEIRGELEDSGFQLEYYSEEPYGHAVGRR